MNQIEMTYHIIGCGQTAQHWQGQGPSIGVNDAEKWGFMLDHLVIVNAPNQFQDSRLQTILKSTPGKVWSHMPEFWGNFKNIEKIRPIEWVKGEKIRDGVVHCSKTSPFIAMSLAYNMGAKEIVLWGVDLINHPKFGVGQSKHVNEMLKFDSYIKALKEKGVEVFIGAKGTSFDNILNVWNASQS
jgi:hypothetical protein